MSVTTRSGARLQASGSAALPPAAGHRGQRPSPRQQAHHKPSPNSAAACLVLVSLCALAGCCALLLGRQRLGRPSAVPPVGARQTTTHRHHHSHTSCPPGTQHRIIAVGDLHGNLQKALRVLKHFGLVTTTTAAAAADSSSVSRNGTGSSSAAASLSSPSAGRGGPEAGLLVGEQEQGQERQREGAASVEEEAERALWAGGCSVLLQTGDLVDRGPHSLELLSLMHRLQEQAAQAGGAVRLLLGNHELMNLQGDYRYVSRAERMQLGRRSRQLPTGDPAAASATAAAGGGEDADVARGKLAWHALFSPGGDLWRALRRHHEAALVEGVGSCRSLFTHAAALEWLLRLPGSLETAAAAAAVPDASGSGSSKAAGTESSGTDADHLLARWNRLLQLAAFDCGSSRRQQQQAAKAEAQPLECGDPELRRLMQRAVGGDGPLWSRAFTSEPDHKLCPAVSRILNAVGAQRVVVGHTIQENERINTRCGGKVVFIDVALGFTGADEFEVWTCDSSAEVAAWTAAAAADAASGAGGAAGGSSNFSSTSSTAARTASAAPHAEQEEVEALAASVAVGLGGVVGLSSAAVSQPAAVSELTGGGRQQRNAGTGKKQQA